MNDKIRKNDIPASHEIQFGDGIIQVLKATGHHSIPRPSDDTLLEFRKESDIGLTKFDIALVNHEHTLYSSSQETEVSDVEWNEWVGKRNNVFDFSLKKPKITSFFEKMIHIVNSVPSNDNIKKSEDPCIEYLKTIREISQIMLDELNGSGNHGLSVVPFRSATLVAEIFSKKGNWGIIPIRMTRISRGSVSDQKFSVGMSSSRTDFRSAIMQDLYSLDKKELNILEMCTATALTSCSLLSFLHSLNVSPKKINLVVPAASRKGLMNFITSAEALGVDLAKISIYSAKIFPRLGRSWSKGEDSVKTLEGLSVVGDPPKIIGTERLHEQIARVESQFAQRHGINIF